MKENVCSLKAIKIKRPVIGMIRKKEKKTKKAKTQITNTKNETKYTYRP